MHYPLFLDISATHCLVVGGGAVGLRKAKGLLQAQPASVLVLDVKAFGPQWQDVQQPALRCEVRPFAENDLIGRGLIFACTGSAAVNAAIAAACALRGLWCNCADAPRKGNCIVPAVARQGDVVAALSTGGGSPALASVLREELDTWLAPAAAMATVLSRLRPHVLARQADTSHNTALFRNVVRSALRKALAAHDMQQCEAILRECLPDALHPLIPELLHELF